MKIILSSFLFLIYMTGFTQNFEWAKLLVTGAWGDINIWDCKTDNAGFIYIAGKIDSIQTFDPTGSNITVNGGSAGDSFVAKMDSLGGIVWIVKNHCPFTDEILSVFVDDSNSVYVTGKFYDSIDIMPGAGEQYLYANGGGTEIYLQKLDSNGNLVWGKSFGGNICTSCTEKGTDVVVDHNGNVYVTGLFSGPADFDPGLDTFIVNGQGPGYYDQFLLKLDSLGQIDWVLSFKANSLSPPTRLAITENNEVVYLGRFNSVIDIDPDTSVYNLTPISTSDLFIIKLSSSGEIISAKTLDNPTMGEILEDSEHNIIVLGSFTAGGSPDFDPGPGVFTLTAQGSFGSTDCYVLKLDSMLNFIWAKSFGSLNSDWGYNMSLDQFNSMYITGVFSDSSDLDPGLGINMVYSAGLADIFSVKLDSQGNFVWGNSIGDPGSNIYQTSVVTPNGNFYRMIDFTGTVDFNYSLLPSDTLFLTGSSMGSASLECFKQNLCSYISLTIDSTHNISCLDSGYANAIIYPSNLNFNYSWNTTPAQNTNIAAFNQPGIYTLNAFDSIYNCAISRQVLIDGAFQNSIDLIANGVFGSFRTGNESYIVIDGFNTGCIPVSGSLSIVLDPLVGFNSAYSNPDFISGDTLIWNFTDLTYDSLHITPVINVTTLGQIGDTVCFTVMIDPVSGDADSTNNYKTYCFPVVNGYDPNDKQVYPQGECFPNYVLNESPLTYTIRFQNTGNADAINIHILDTLDPNLDLNTLRVIGNSHYLITEILPGNVMNFRFDNIHLPDSGTNELLSHGYVIYEVSPMVGTPEYTLINNTSHIYFDFNPAIITNTTFNTLVDSIPSYTTTENVSVCYNSEYTLPDGTVLSNIVSPVLHQSNLWMVDGCDSTIFTNITILPIIDTGVTLNGFTVSANAAGLNYQWINCNSGLPIAGQNSIAFSPSFDGDYAVIISDNNCSDTSACISVTGLGVSDYSDSDIQLFPNPAQDEITVIVAEENTNAHIEIYSLNGQVLYSVTSQSSLTSISVNDFSPGIYFVKVKTEKGASNFKLVKE